MILGTIIGFAGGLIQDFITSRTEGKKDEQDKKHELSKIKLEAELGIKQANISLDKEKYKAQSSLSEVAINEQKTSQAWLDGIKKTTAYIKGDGLFVDIANFIIATHRPLLTYFLGVFCFYIYSQSQNAEWIYNFALGIQECFFTAVGFWFQRRSSEKLKTHNSKKKL